MRGGGIRLLRRLLALRYECSFAARCGRSVCAWACIVSSRQRTVRAAVSASMLALAPAARPRPGLHAGPAARGARVSAATPARPRCAPAMLGPEGPRRHSLREPSARSAQTPAASQKGWRAARAALGPCASRLRFRSAAGCPHDPLRHHRALHPMHATVVPSARPWHAGTRAPPLPVAPGGTRQGRFMGRRAAQARARRACSARFSH